MPILPLMCFNRVFLMDVLLTETGHFQVTAWCLELDLCLSSRPTRSLAEAIADVGPRARSLAERAQHPGWLPELRETWEALAG